MPLYDGLDIGDSIGGGTVGSILFIGTGIKLAQDNGGIFWNNVQNTLGINTTGVMEARITILGIQNSDKYGIGITQGDVNDGVTTPGYCLKLLGNGGASVPFENTILRVLQQAFTFTNNNPLAEQSDSRFGSSALNGLVAGKVVADADTICIDDAPSGSANVAITRPQALRIKGGGARIVGGLALDATTARAAGKITGMTDGTAATDGATVGQVTAAIQNVVARSIAGTDTIIASDKGKLLILTGDAYTLAITAAATLGNGFWCYLRYDGAGAGDDLVTVDADGGELIDGIATMTMYTKECRLLQCTGAAFSTILLTGGEVVYAGNDNFKVPTRFSGCKVIVVASGGSGAGGEGRAAGNLRLAGSAAGGGSRLEKQFTPGDLGAAGGNIAITVGAAVNGGAGGVTNVGVDGANGNNSSFGTLAIAYGGGGGNWDATGSTGGSGGGEGEAGAIGVASAGTTRGGGNPTTNVIGTGGAGGGCGAGTGKSATGTGGGGGGASSATGAGVTLLGGSSTSGGSGGGGGGGVTAANAAAAGSDAGAVGTFVLASGGGAAGGAATGVQGTDGTNAPSSAVCGGGGGGGGGNSAGTGGRGGHGGIPGGAGGGGGGGTNTGGAGGNSGRGQVSVWYW